MARVYEGYEEIKRGQSRMDMEDVLLFAAGLLADEEAVAAQVRRQYKWLVVDEFQDVSPLQSALLDLWLGGRDEICVVGDPAQTIYSFAGANASYLRDFAQKHPGTTSIELVRNYRSTPQVVSAANQLLAGTPSQGVQLKAQQPAGPEVTYSAHPDEVAEATAAADRIAALRSAGTAAGEIAILFRINAQSETFEDALSRRKIPYVVRGAARFFDRPEVRQAVTLLRGTARSGQGDGSVGELVRATLSGMGWSSEPPGTRGETRNRWESLQALVDQAAQFVEEHPGADLGALVDDLDRRASEQHAPVADGVTLATLHTAKGLEWDAVFLCGMQDGTLPFVYAETPAGDRGGAAPALRRDDARSTGPLRLLGARAQSRRPRIAQAVPLPAGGGRGGAVSAPPSASRNRKARHCRECGGPLGSPAEKKIGRCSDCPASYDEALFERSARVAPRPGRRRQRARLRGLHRRDAPAHRRAPSQRRARPVEDQRGGCLQADEVWRRPAGRAGR